VDDGLPEGQGTSKNRRDNQGFFRQGAPVPDPRAIHNLALVGFMGCGKSTVGRAVAGELGFEFVDTDTLVEEAAGKPVSEVFASAGEEGFRKLESEAIASLETRRGFVIATGGGAVTFSGNLASLKRHALVVCLWAGAEALHDRTKHQTHRPLLQQENPLEVIRALLVEREPHYKKADVIINTEHRPQRVVIAQVKHQFEESSGGGTSADSAAVS
jgi:shikimate kinase